MSFIVEWLITHFLKLFVKKHFGWDEHKYLKIIRNSKEFVFQKQSVFFVVLKFSVFFLMFVSSVVCFALYFYGLYHNQLDVLDYKNHHFLLTPYNNSLIYSAWAFLLFGISFLVDLREEFVELKGKKTKIQWWNTLSSCLFPYFITLFIVCAVRLILVFALDKCWILLDFQRDFFYHSTFSYNLGVLYLLLVIFDVLLLVFITWMLIIHSHLKLVYFLQCIKLNQHWKKKLQLKDDVYKALKAKQDAQQTTH